MKLHARHTIVNEARHAFVSFLLDLEKKLGLHYEDLFSCLSERLSVLAHGSRTRWSVARALGAPSAVQPKRSARLRLALAAVGDESRRIQTAHTLTYGEWFSILGGEIANLAKYLIRSERHPEDPDKRGDEA